VYSSRGSLSIPQQDTADAGFKSAKFDMKTSITEGAEEAHGSTFATSSVVSRYQLLERPTNTKLCAP
jgi:hypothetical protein